MLITKDLKEWIKEYEQKTGTEFFAPKGSTMFYVPNRGFGQYIVDTKNNAVMIFAVCGDGKYWRDFGVQLCYNYKCKWLQTHTMRNIHPYLRFFECKIEHEDCDEEGYPVHLTGTNWLGKKMMCGCSYELENKGKEKYAYYVSNEIL